MEKTKDVLGKIAIFQAILWTPSAVFSAAALSNPLTATTSIPPLIDLIITAFMLITMPIVVVSIVYVGFLFVTANGNEEKLRKAKVLLFWTLVGAAIIMGAKLIGNIVLGTWGLIIT